MFIIQRIFVSTLIQTGTHPLSSSSTRKESCPKTVRAIRLDGMITSRQKREIIASRGLVHLWIARYSRLL